MDESRLSAGERERYERHLIIEQFGEEEQQLLIDTRVIVVGAGGLGSAVLQYLVAAGVGTIGLVEFDSVSTSNLQRQILYTTHDLGGPKAELAAERLIAINPGAQVTTFAVKLTDANAEDILEGYDIVVDCTDNFAARYTIDRAAQKLVIPMVYGTAQGATGQVSIFNTEGAGSYEDLYPEEESQEDGKPVGVLSPMPGIVGCIQAMEVIKLATGYGETLVGRLLTIDAATMTFRVFDL